MFFFVNSLSFDYLGATGVLRSFKIALNFNTASVDNVDNWASDFAVGVFDQTTQSKYACVSRSGGIV